MYFDFGTRNIIGMNYTRYVSLPKPWIDALKLKKGDPIRIEMDADRRLILTPLKEEVSV